MRYAATYYLTLYLNDKPIGPVIIQKHKPNFNFFAAVQQFSSIFVGNKSPCTPEKMTFPPDFLSYIYRKSAFKRRSLL